jgi:endonuclease/exonuclease/phosphatase family metal-dependent hydrolase
MNEHPRQSFSVLTYNVHSCVGTDRKLDVGRVADIIRAHEADIVMLQELDVGRLRTGNIDQAHELASRLEMSHHFHAAMHVENERYGDAILTRHPVRLVRSGPLPSVGEPRGAIWAEVTVGAQTINVINTHLGLRSAERMAQVAELLGPDWMGSERCRQRPTIFGGDLNAIPSSAVFRSIGMKTEARGGMRWQRLPATFPSRFPILRLDHIFHSADLEMTDISTVRTARARIASDHLPLVARFRFAATGET